MGFRIPNAVKCDEGRSPPLQNGTPMTATLLTPTRVQTGQKVRQRLVTFGLFMAEGLVVQGCGAWDVRFVDEARKAVRNLRRTGTSLQDR
jgi:hypothetical protein